MLNDCSLKCWSIIFLQFLIKRSTFFINMKYFQTIVNTIHVMVIVNEVLGERWVFLMCSREHYRGQSYNDKHQFSSHFIFNSMQRCTTGSFSTIPLPADSIAPNGNNIAIWSLQPPICYNMFILWCVLGEAYRSDSIYFGFKLFVCV